MRKGVVLSLMVCLAVIAAAVAAIVVSINRASEAKSYAEAEAAQADAESAKARTAKAEAEAEAEKRRAAEATAKAKHDELEAKRLEKETAEAEAKTAAENSRAMADAAKKAASEAEAARATKEAEKAKADAARSEELKAKEAAAAATAKAETEQVKLALEKTKADKLIAETKMMELQKIDFENLERELLEWKLNLEERERLLMPEKSIADLSWAGGMEDSIIDDKGNVTKKTKTAYDPENDLTLPRETRKLAKTERIVGDQHKERSANVRKSIIKSLESLYVAALRENRVIDAEYYRKSILTMYPDWHFEGENAAKGNDSQK